MKIFILIVLASLNVIAAGGGGSKPTLPPTAPNTAATYEKMMSEGKGQIEKKDWSSAITSFKTATELNAQSADAFNYLGYSTRKQGHPKEALEFYNKALALDPKHLGALEYQGEAYVELGQIAEATKNLEKLKALCGTKCENYLDLENFIKKTKIK